MNLHLNINFYSCPYFFNLFSCARTPRANGARTHFCDRGSRKEKNTLHRTKSSKSNAFLHDTNTSNHNHGQRRGHVRQAGTDVSRGRADVDEAKLDVAPINTAKSESRHRQLLDVDRDDSILRFEDSLCLSPHQPGLLIRTMILFRCGYPRTDRYSWAIHFLSQQAILTHSKKLPPTFVFIPPPLPKTAPRS